ncbi:MAG: CopG family transcriptional regulator [Nanoarchaeota archaeon]|nr:CopG family transcriptional regulator [Nanoarchaeota archaeon]
MKSITFTNNLSFDLMQWMEKYSVREKLTRRAVLEKALTEFRKSVRRKEYADSFRKASFDLDIKNMAEDGLGDYFKQLTYLEK